MAKGYPPEFRRRVLALLQAGEGAATFANIAANDRVVVTIRAKRSTDATGLALVVASRVVDKGPKLA